MGLRLIVPLEAAVTISIHPSRVGWDLRLLLSTATA